MSDSDDDSDFEEMLKAASRSRRMSRTRDEENPSASSDNSEDECVQLSRSSKKKNLSFEQRMAQMNHKNNISNRKRQMRSKDSNLSNDESSSDEVSAAPPHRATRLTAKKSPQKSRNRWPPRKSSRQSAQLSPRRSRRLQAKSQVDDASSFVASDGDDGVLKSKQKPSDEDQDILDISSEEEEEEGGSVSHRASALSRQLQEAQANLQAIDVDLETEGLNDQENESPANQVLTISVEVSIDTNGTKTDKKTSLVIRADDPLECVQEALLLEFELPMDSSTICKFRCGAVTLRNERTFSSYYLDATSTLHANIFVATWDRSVSKKAKAKEPTDATEKTLELKLRTGDSTETVTYGLNRPFKELIALHGPLEFDGEIVSEDSTPALYGTIILPFKSNTIHLIAHSEMLPSFENTEMEDGYLLEVGN